MITRKTAFEIDHPYKETLIIEGHVNDQCGITRGFNHRIFMGAKSDPLILESYGNDQNWKTDNTRSYVESVVSSWRAHNVDFKCLTSIIHTLIENLGSILYIYDNGDNFDPDTTELIPPIHVPQYQWALNVESTHMRVMNSTIYNVHYGLINKPSTFSFYMNDLDLFNQILYTHKLLN